MGTTWTRELLAEKFRKLKAELTRQGIATKECRGAWTHSVVGYILERAA